MKIEEAIKIIEVAKAECEWSAPLDYQEAFDMAIEALKSQEDTRILNVPDANAVKKYNGLKEVLRKAWVKHAPLELDPYFAMILSELDNYLKPHDECEGGACLIHFTKEGQK